MRRTPRRPDPKLAQQLRANMSLPEMILWRGLANGKLRGLKFRKQHPMLEYVIDFYCADRRLAVEIDGAQHDEPEQARHDLRRDQRLAELGVLTLRFPAIDVLSGDEPTGVLERIAEVALARTSLRTPHARPGFAGTRTPPASGRTSR